MNRVFLISIFSFIFLISSYSLLFAKSEYGIGESADVQGISVSILSIRPHKESNRFMRKPGMKYYALDIQIVNGTRELYEYNAYQFTMMDEQEEDYQWCISGVEPKFEGERLEPGMKGRGILVFGIPTERKPAYILFDPGMINGKVISDEITFNIKLQGDR